MRFKHLALAMMISILTIGGDAAIAAMNDGTDQGRGMRKGLPAQTKAQAQERVEAYFARVDANRDGFLTADEYAKESERRAEKRMARMKARGIDPATRPGLQKFQANSGKRLDRSDTNGDGKVTRAELMTSAMARFEKNDTDGDGTVTAEERRAKWQGRKRNRGA